MRGKNFTGCFGENAVLLDAFLHQMKIHLLIFEHNVPQSLLLKKGQTFFLRCSHAKKNKQKKPWKR